MQALLLCVCMLVSCSLFADEWSIHRMLADGKMLELAETRQLTLRAHGEAMIASISPDGKYVAYTDTDSSNDRLCLVRTTGGQPSVIMARPAGSDEDGFVGEIWEPHVNYCWHVAWSPDSGLFALPVSHVFLSEKSSPFEYGIAVYRSSGALRTYAQLRGFADAMGPFRWSPDGSKLACTFFIRERDVPKGTKPTQQLIVLDISSGSLQSLVSRQTKDIKLESWRADGKAIQYTISEGGETQLREVTLDGKKDEVIQGDYSAGMKSPDGVLQAVGGSGLSIRNCLTGEVIEVLETLDGKVLGWSSNSKMFVYQKATVVKDETGKRRRTLNALWLAAAEANPFNHMCAALDAYGDEPPTWSKDCMKMAYASDGRVYVAEFVWKDLTASDKLEAGIRLTEEEEKNVLTANAKIIGASMFMYAADNDHKFPPGDTFSQDLMDYLRGANLFNRPGTNQMAFQYFPLGNIADVKYPATTMIGMFDVGYGWQIVLYADGHVQIVPK